jgi:putative ABC transport system substrate-binding protein
MRRREFITLLGSAAVEWPLAARGQQRERVRRIGALLPVAADDAEFSAPPRGIPSGAGEIGLDHRPQRTRTLRGRPAVLTER